jgi:hypothetical protein
MGGRVNKHEKMRNWYKCLVENSSQEKKRIGRSRHTWEDNVVT